MGEWLVYENTPLDEYLKQVEASEDVIQNDPDTHEENGEIIKRAYEGRVKDGAQSQQILKQQFLYELARLEGYHATTNLQDQVNFGWGISRGVVTGIVVFFVIFFYTVYLLVGITALLSAFPALIFYERSNEWLKAILLQHLFKTMREWDTIMNRVTQHVREVELVSHGYRLTDARTPVERIVRRANSTLTKQIRIKLAKHLLWMKQFPCLKILEDQNSRQSDEDFMLHTLKELIRRAHSQRISWIEQYLTLGRSPSVYCLILLNYDILRDLKQLRMLQSDEDIQLKMRSDTVPDMKSPIQMLELQLRECYLRFRCGISEGDGRGTTSLLQGTIQQLGHLMEVASQVHAKLEQTDPIPLPNLDLPSPNEQADGLVDVAEAEYTPISLMETEPEDISQLLQVYEYDHTKDRTATDPEHTPRMKLSRADRIRLQAQKRQEIKAAHTEQNAKFDLYSELKSVLDHRTVLR